MRSTPTILALVVLSLALRPDRALAEGDVAAPACVPTDLTLIDQLYDSAGNGYAFFGSSFGTFTVTCPVTLSNGNYKLNFSYANDTDGAGTDYYVKVEWKKRSRTTGAVSFVCSEFSSSSSTPCSSSSYAVDNVGYYYFVYVRLHRKATQATSIRFNGLSFAEQ